MEINKKEMTQEEKELLIKDLCGRLLYGVKTSYSGYEMTVRGVDVESKTVDVIDWGKARFAAVRIEKIKPYLRTLDDLTDEEKRQYELLTKHYAPNPYPVMDWLNEHHVDYRGLIPKGLALKAKEGIYNNKTK